MGNECIENNLHNENITHVQYRLAIFTKTQKELLYLMGHDGTSIIRTIACENTNIKAP